MTKNLIGTRNLINKILKVNFGEDNLWFSSLYFTCLLCLLHPYDKNERIFFTTIDNLFREVLNDEYSGIDNYGNLLLDTPKSYFLRRSQVTNIHVT